MRTHDLVTTMDFPHFGPFPVVAIGQEVKRNLLIATLPYSIQKWGGVLLFSSTFTRLVIWPGNIFDRVFFNSSISQNQGVQRLRAFPLGLIGLFIISLFYCNPYKPNGDSPSRDALSCWCSGVGVLAQDITHPVMWREQRRKTVAHLGWSW